MDSNSKPGMIKIYGNSKLSERINEFQVKADQHHKKQLANPFSAKYVNPVGISKESSNKNPNLSFDKNDPRYGKPPEGSKTEKRGLRAGNQISKEIVELCCLIRENGIEIDDGRSIITFGELFQIYTVISNKVVGILLRARKHGLLDFEGEMLFQRRDDDKIITLFPIENSLGKDDDEDN